MTFMTYSDQLRTLRSQLDQAAKEGDTEKIQAAINQISALVNRIYVRTQVMPPEWAEIERCYSCYMN